MLVSLEAELAYDVGDQLDRITAPTLVIGGAKDPYNPADELQQRNLPDLQHHLQQSWHTPVRAVFCISARRHLQDPRWPQDEQPLHANDDFPQLRAAIFGSLDQGGRVVDARIEREDLAGIEDAVRVEGVNADHVVQGGERVLQLFPLVLTDHLLLHRPVHQFLALVTHQQGNGVQRSHLVEVVQHPIRVPHQSAVGLLTETRQLV